MSRVNKAVLIGLTMVLCAAGCGTTENDCELASAHAAACTGADQATIHDQCDQSPTLASELLAQSCAQLQTDGKGDGFFDFLFRSNAENGVECGWNSNCKNTCRPISQDSKKHKCAGFGWDDGLCDSANDCAMDLFKCVKAKGDRYGVCTR